MNRAERLKQQGDNKRGFTVGFALTVLQRRLASSPEAIFKSLKRRRRRLERRRDEMRYGDHGTSDTDLARRLREMLGRDLPDDNDDLDDLPSGEAEEIESEVADAATTAKTIAELDKEILILTDLEEIARRVQHSGTDKKWTELRALLADNALIADASGNVRKIIVFTEHRDTLEYLTGRIRDLLGRPEAVVFPEVGDAQLAAHHIPLKTQLRAASAYRDFLAARRTSLASAMTALLNSLGCLPDAVMA